MLVVTMDLKKTQRVRRLITSGFYTDPEVLDPILESLVDRHCGQIVHDIERCDKVSQESCKEQAVGVHAQIVDDLMEYPPGGDKRYHAIVADVVASSLRKLADLASMHKAVSLHAR
jgi:hypothetical protein